MNRNLLIKHIDLHKSKLGSYKAVAEKCKINVGSLSTIMAGKYGADEAKMLQRIAVALDYRESNWVIVPTIGNYRRIATVYNDAKNESMWFIISNKAGSGKTATMEDLFNHDTTGSVTLLQAEEWSGRQFLNKLIEKIIGESALQGRYKTIAQLTDIVANYFNDMGLERPILKIDEADKLKPSALRTLIPIYNRTEDRLAVILSGTENLEKEIRAGVKNKKKGYDELESRCGRTYIHLDGVNEKEIYEICAANGIADVETVGMIWGELEKVYRNITTNTGKTVALPLVEDMRRIKRLIKRELLKQNKQAA